MGAASSGQGAGQVLFVCLKAVPVKSPTLSGVYAAVIGGYPLGVGGRKTERKPVPQF